MIIDINVALFEYEKSEKEKGVGLIEGTKNFHKYLLQKEAKKKLDRKIISDSDMQLLDKATIKDSWHQTWYEGYLMPSDYQPQAPEIDWNAFLKTCRKVYFYFSSRVSALSQDIFPVPEVLPTSYFNCFFAATCHKRVLFEDHSVQIVFISHITINQGNILVQIEIFTLHACQFHSQQ